MPDTVWHMILEKVPEVRKYSSQRLLGSQNAGKPVAFRDLSKMDGPTPARLLFLDQVVGGLASRMRLPNIQLEECAISETIKKSVC